MKGWEYSEDQQQRIREALPPDSDPERVTPQRLNGLARTYLRAVDESSRNQEASEALSEAAAQARSLRAKLLECRDGFGSPAWLLYEQLGLADLTARLDAMQEEIRPGGRIDRTAASLRRGTGRPRNEALRRFVWEMAELWEAATGTRATCYPSSYHGYGGAFLAFARACILPVDPECRDSLIQKAVESRRKRGEDKATAPARPA